MYLLSHPVQPSWCSWAWGGWSFKPRRLPVLLLSTSRAFFVSLSPSQPFLTQIPAHLCQALRGVRHKHPPAPGHRAQLCLNILPVIFGVTQPSCVSETLCLNSLSVKWKIKEIYSQSLPGVAESITATPVSSQGWL